MQCRETARTRRVSNNCSQQSEGNSPGAAPRSKGKGRPVTSGYKPACHSSPPFQTQPPTRGRSGRRAKAASCSGRQSPTGRRSADKNSSTFPVAARAAVRQAVDQCGPAGGRTRPFRRGGQVFGKPAGRAEGVSGCQSVSRRSRRASLHKQSARPGVSGPGPFASRITLQRRFRGTASSSLKKLFFPVGRTAASRPRRCALSAKARRVASST